MNIEKPLSAFKIITVSSYFVGRDRFSFYWNYLTHKKEVIKGKVSLFVKEFKFVMFSLLVIKNFFMVIFV